MSDELVRINERITFTRVTVFGIPVVFDTRMPKNAIDLVDGRGGRTRFSLDGLPSEPSGKIGRDA